MSEHSCNVVQIRLEPHPNADKLSIVKVGGFQCVVRTDEWTNGDLAVYIEPDSVVPDNKMFEFLGGQTRIRTRKLRGEWSMGLLIKAPEGARIGEDYMDELGIVHYEPPPNTHNRAKMHTGNTEGPKIIAPAYDVENLRKDIYSDCFQDGEEVIVTEKMHGANARFVCVDDVVYCGSRRWWKKKNPNNLWWKAFEQNPVLDAWLRHNQNLVLYGEVFGQVQKLKYGAMQDQIFFAAFDILDGTTGKWLDYDDARKIASPIPWAPLIYRGSFDFETIASMAEEDSSWPGADHHREGVVVGPVKERTHRQAGRVKLKIVGNRYLSKN